MIGTACKFRRAGVVTLWMFLASYSYAFSPKIEVEYPKIAVKNCIEGRVQVGFSIRSDGHVESPKVLFSSSVIFEDAALDAARNLYYSPEHIDGFIDNVKFVFNFQLDPKVHKHCFNQHQQGT